MKRFFGLFTAIFITITIAACSDSTGPNSGFAPYTVGSFRITSPDEGLWIGSQASAYSKGARALASDSVITFDAPNGNSLKLLKADTFFQLAYTDSNKYYDLGRALRQDELSVSDSLSDKNANFIYSPYNNYYQVILQLKDIKCDSTYNYNGQALSISIHPDSLPAQKIIIHADGLPEAMNAMRCS